MAENAEKAQSSNRAETVAAFIADHPDRAVHWHFPGMGFCEEYVTGDTVLGAGDDRSLVDCQECLELIHA